MQSPRKSKCDLLKEVLTPDFLTLLGEAGYRVDKVTITFERADGKPLGDYDRKAICDLIMGYEVDHPAPSKTRENGLILSDYLLEVNKEALRAERTVLVRTGSRDWEITDYLGEISEDERWVCVSIGDIRPAPEEGWEIWPIYRRDGPEGWIETGEPYLEILSAPPSSPPSKTSEPYENSLRRAEQAYPLTAVVTQDGDWYVAQCLEVDIVSQGKSFEEAVKNLKEALELYFEETAPMAGSETGQPFLQLIATIN